MAPAPDWPQCCFCRLFLYVQRGARGWDPWQEGQRQPQPSPVNRNIVAEKRNCQELWSLVHEHSAEKLTFRQAGAWGACAWGRVGSAWGRGRGCCTEGAMALAEMALGVWRREGPVPLGAL